MAEYINGINPEILKWARERSGYSLEAAAKALNKEKPFIIECESGQRTMTYVQLETLADKYKRPVAMFFFPEIPNEPNITEKLSLRKTDIEKLNPRVHILFRQAYARQISLMELNSGTNKSENIIFRDIKAQPDDSPIVLAKQTRNYLNISIEQQKAWKDPTEALKSWRECIQDKGIFIFKDSFKDDFVDGFCLLHDEFPVIYLNNSMHHVRQIFSLFHELGHILLGKAGVTQSTKLPSGKIEKFCNQFAAEFLLPTDDIKPNLDFSIYDNDTIKKLSEWYKVSRPVTLIKLVELGIIKQADYRQYLTQWIEEQRQYQQRKRSGASPGGGNYYYTQAEYLGTKFMNLAFSQYHQGHCSVEQLSEHLNVKAKQIPQFEEQLIRRVFR